MAVRHPFVALDRLEGGDLRDAGRRGQVVEDRLVAREALEAHDLLGQARPVVAELDVALTGDLASDLVRGHRRKDSQASRASAARRSPIAGANLKPWPEQGEPTTIWPPRSRMKLSSSVVVYMQVSAPTGSGPARRYVSFAHAVIRSTSSGSGSRRSSPRESAASARSARTSPASGWTTTKNPSGTQIGKRRSASSASSRSQATPQRSSVWAVLSSSVCTISTRP